MIRKLLLLSVVFVFVNTLPGTQIASAQSVTTRTGRLLLTDGAGHNILIAPPSTGWPGTGTFTFTLPIPPTGLSAAFVEPGTSILTSLQWDTTNKYWKAVAGGSGGVTGSGTANSLTKWATTSTLTSSLISDNGSTVSITNGALLLSGTTGATPASGAGTRMMWIPAKAAFRAGSVTGTHWDDVSVGSNSYAMGNNAVANGANSVALGSNASTSNFSGSFVYGDNSSGSASNTAANQFFVKATGGVQLITTAGGTSPDFGVTSGALLVRGTGTTPVSGAGTRMMWIPERRAFRAGNVDGAHWNNDSIGLNSIATGFNAVADGSESVSLGWKTRAIADGTVAIGNGANALGFTSTAIGNGVWATGSNSLAMGAGTFASGSNSTAMGNTVNTNGFDGSFIYGDNSVSTKYSTASNQFMIRSTGGFHILGVSGDTASTLRLVDGAFIVRGGSGIGPTSGVAGTCFMWLPGKKALRAGEATGPEWNDASIGSRSVAFGWATTASGSSSTAMGVATTASGASSTAMGNFVSTNGQDGSFIHGDNSTTTFLNSTAAHQYMVRAAGGTIIYSNAACSTGVTLAANGGSWASVSDSNRKENRLNINGEDILNSISKMWMGSWNYKGQDASLHRHYGPMAQEFFAAFGNDGIGIIGNDTTLATADVDGVTLIAVKTLVERTTTLSRENADLREELEAIKTELRSLRNVEQASW